MSRASVSGPCGSEAVLLSWTIGQGVRRRRTGEASDGQETAVQREVQGMGSAEGTAGIAQGKAPVTR